MFRWQNTLSVRGPLIAVISLILVAGFLATNIISYQVSKHSLRQALIDNELPLTSNNIYSEIQNDLLRPIFIASLMANDTFVKDWLLGGERNLDSITRYLDEIRKKYGVFTSFLISDKTRKYYHFSGLSQVISQTDPADAWYFRIRAMKEPYEINLDLNAQQENALTIFINHRVDGYDGRFLAAIGVGLEFKTVAKVVDRYKALFGRNIYFVDNQGKISVRSDGALVTEDNIRTAPGISEIAQPLLATDHGFFEYLRDGETMLVNSRYIPELKWRVVVEQRESEALRAIRQGLITTTLVGLGVIALTILVVTYAVNLFHARLEAMATTDALTGIGNRSAVDLSLHHALKRFARDGNPFSVILLDIDNFKRVNDTLGHLEGDRVIRAIAQLVRDTVRESDILCRWGGEELIVLANDCALDSAAMMAEKIRAAIEAARFTNLPDGSAVTASAGVTAMLAADDADTIIGRADGALFRAKQEGRNCVREA